MAKPKKFDTITIIGVIAAVALLIGGQMYMARKQEAYRQYVIAEKKKADDEAKKKAEEQAKLDAEKPKVEPKIEAVGPQNPDQPKDPKDPAPKDPAPKDPAPKDPVPAPKEEEEPKDGGDITVTTGKLELTFSARGATIKHAKLANVPVDPSVPANPPAPGNLGLEILTVIEEGKRTFGLPSFEIGPSDPDQEKDRIVFDKDEGTQRSLDRRIWKLESDSGGFDSSGNRQIAYSAALAGKYTVTKTFTINQDKRHVLLDVAVTNRSDVPVSYLYTINGPAGILLDGPAANPKGGAYVAIIAELAGRDPAQTMEPTLKLLDASSAASEEKNSVSYPQNIWAAQKNRFYMAMLISIEPTQLLKLRGFPIKTDPTSVDKRLAEPNLGLQGVRRKSSALAAGATAKADPYALYLGPSNEGHLLETETDLALTQYHLPEAIQYCDIFGARWPRVDWIARKMMILFTALHSIFGSYGIAVILLTVCIKLALHPLQRKMMVSMQKMQKLQPELKKITDKYKGQTSTEARQRMFQEQQDVMRKAGANPIAGCLPMFLQIPIFSALYGIFNRAFEIRGAEFLWIKDLSQQDRVAHLPFWPYDLNLLPIIYMAVTILQTKISPAPKSDDPQQEMNRKMMMFMPVMFSLLFYSMPSGLVLYFAAQAIFGMIETWYIKKYVIRDDEPPPSGSASGGKPPPPVVPAKA